MQLLNDSAVFFSLDIHTGVALAAYKFYEVHMCKQRWKIIYHLFSLNKILMIYIKFEGELRVLSERLEKEGRSTILWKYTVLRWKTLQIPLKRGGGDNFALCNFWMVPKNLNQKEFKEKNPIEYQIFHFLLAKEERKIKIVH